MDTLCSPTASQIAQAFCLWLLLLRACRRTPDGDHKVEWDEERGLNRTGMNLPVQCVYIGCIDMEVTDEAEQEAIEALLLEQFR